METEKNYQGFTLSLALVDALPVIIFLISAVLISVIFKSFLFATGVFFCVIAGGGKVLWKIILALKKKNYMLLNRQFRIILPLGFLLIIASLIVNFKRINFKAVLASVTGVPSVIFFILGVVGMTVMAVFAKKLDSSVRSNWIEQLTNTVSQFFILLGIIFLI